MANYISCQLDEDDLELLTIFLLQLGDALAKIAILRGFYRKRHGKHKRGKKPRGDQPGKRPPAGEKKEGGDETPEDELGIILSEL